jgi:hypothetical protein
LAAARLPIMSFNRLLGYGAPEALDQAAFTGRPQDAIKVLDQPNRRQLPGVLHLRQVRGRAVYELGERVQAQPSGRPEPPDLSTEIRPPGSRRIKWIRRPTKTAGSTAHRWNLVLHCSPPAEPSSPLDGKTANKLSCPSLPHRHR